MPNWLDTTLVFAAIGGALGYFLVRGIRRWRASASSCGNDCGCNIAKPKNQLRPNRKDSAEAGKTNPRSR